MINGRNDMKSRLLSLLSKPLLLAIGCAALSACVSFGGTKAPPSLLILTPTAKVADGAAKSALQKDALIVLAPAVPRKLDINRIPVQIDNSSFAYVKQAYWADKPAKLMQSLLTETITAKTGRLILDETDAGGQAGSYLSGSLLEFGVDARSNEAVVIYDAVWQERGKAVAKRRFEARSPVGVIEAETVGVALNSAANDVAGEIADWLAAKP
jgi:cholesterol transport system auxiliary component